MLVKHGTERYTSPVGFFKTHKPISVVVLEEKSDLWLNVYYKGEKWSIMKNEIYPLEEESVG